MRNRTVPDIVGRILPNFGKQVVEPTLTREIAILRNWYHSNIWGAFAVIGHDLSRPQTFY
jgi:hypothetical protein